MAHIDSTAKPRHILVFEPLTGGHRAEFLGHLIEHIRRAERGDRKYTFVVGRGHALEVPDGVSLREVTPEQERILARSRGSLGGWAMWRILKSYIAELAPDHVLLMDLTWLELPLCFCRPSCTFSGILFVQYPELCSVPKPGWRRWARFWIKDIKTHRFLHNRMLRRIYLLNGMYSSNFLNSRFGVTRYFPVPDPVPPIEPDPDANLCRDFGIEAGRRLFLFFGSMSARKGVEPLVTALAGLSKEAARQSAFLFCGLPEAGYAEKYHACIGQLRDRRPDICLHTEEQFVKPERMRALFEQADWILMPYSRPEYSSGILAHAAAARTPVIGPSDGLVGRLIHRQGLGMNVPPKALGGAIEKAVGEEYEFNEDARRAFVDASSPEMFSSIVLSQ